MRYLKFFMFFVLVSVAYCVISIGVFFNQATRTAAQAQELVVSSESLVTETQRRIKDTSQNLNAILLHVDIVAGRIERVSRSQEQASNKYIAILNHTDRLITDSQGNMDQITAHTVQAMDSLQPPMKDLDATVQALNHIVADENIPKTLAAVQASAASVAVTANNVARTTDNVDKIVAHYEKQVTAPVSFMKRVASYAFVALKTVLVFK